MNSAKSPIDVFLSYAIAEHASASIVETALRSANFRVFDKQTVDSSARWQDLIWDQLVASDAVVAVLSNASLNNANVLTDLGAASSWEKPVYVVWTGKSTDDVPSFLNAVIVYPLSKLDELIRELRSKIAHKKEPNRDLLVEVYKQFNTPADQLLLQPSVVKKLTRSFNRRQRTEFSSDDLIRELMRLRKQGQLPRLPAKARQAS